MTTPTPRRARGRHLTAAFLLAGACLTLDLPAPVAAQVPGLQGLADQLFNAREETARRRAAQGLGRAYTPRSVGLLGRALGGESSSQVRLEIVRALRRIAFQRQPGYRDALQAIAGAADDANETDDLVRLRATEALWEAGDRGLLDAVPLVEAQLSDRSQRLRLSAVRMLRKEGSPRAADALGRAVLNTRLSPAVRLAAIDALGAVALSSPGVAGGQVVADNVAVTDHLGLPAVPSRGALELRHERQVAALAALVRDPATTETLTLRAVKSLGRIKDHSSIPVLRELIETHRSLAVRQQATRVLSHVLARQYE